MESKFSRHELPTSFDIDDALSHEESKSTIYGGSINTWVPDYSEQRKLRPYIASVIVIVWGMSIIASAVRAFTTGDVLIVVPPAIITLPLMTVLKFYFRSGQREKRHEYDKST